MIPINTMDTMDHIPTPDKSDINRFRLYQEAKKLVEVRITLIVHVAVYLSVNLLLFLINLTTLSESDYWFVWPALIWGAGVLVHAVFVLLFSHNNIRRWQEVIHGRKRMEMLLGLSVHWSLYIILNLLFIGINAWTYRDEVELGFWSIWIVLGWGIGLAFHSLWVYLNKDHKLKRWKRRKALEMLDDWGGL